VDPDNVGKLLSTTPTEVYNEQRTLSNRGRKRRRVNVVAARARRLVRAQADAAAAARRRERRVRRQAARREVGCHTGTVRCLAVRPGDFIHITALQ
jgi:hypothetical protein